MQFEKNANTFDMVKHHFYYFFLEQQKLCAVGKPCSQSASRSRTKIANTSQMTCKCTHIYTHTQKHTPTRKKNNNTHACIEAKTQTTRACCSKSKANTYLSKLSKIRQKADVDQHLLFLMPIWKKKIYIFFLNDAAN